ncbi:MAG: hypothetical protein KDA80_12370 [Planctomycetaceae bacterium]|nr:hypothetical protein [Planctomycetaceae bacterium]
MSLPLMRTTIFRITLCVTGIALSSFPSESFGGTLQEALKTVSFEVARFLRDAGQRQVAIDGIDVPNSTDRGIALQLTKFLEADSLNVVDVDEFPPFKIVGEVKNFPDADPPISTILVTLKDSNGQEAKDFRFAFDLATKGGRELLEEQLALNGSTPAQIEELPKEGAVIDDPTDVAELNGRPVDFQRAVEERTGLRNTIAPNADSQSFGLAEVRKAQEARDGAVSSALKAQTPFAQKSETRIAASDTSPFEVEILATAPDLTSDPTDADYSLVGIVQRGPFPFAELREGQHYSVRVHNNSDHPVAVELTIDGINSLELCEVESFKAIGKYVVAARGKATLKGWLKNRGEWSTFQLTKQGQSVAAELGRVQKIGVIGVSFYPTWEEGEEEPLFEKLLASTGKSIGTGEGAKVSANEIRDVVRNFGTEPFSIVTVRYRNPDPDDLPQEDEEAN